MKKRIRVRKMTRLANTPSGNPMWHVDAEEGQWRTAPDTNQAYAMSGADEGREVDVMLDSRNRIIGWETPAE